MVDQRLERLANKLSSLNADWQLMEERFTKRMEEMMAALAIKLQPFRAKDPSYLEVTRAEEQPTKETPPSPSPLENHPQYQPHKLPSLGTPTVANPNIHNISPPQTNPSVQPLPKTTAPPPCKDPKPTPTQKTTQITTPIVAKTQHSHKPHLLALPSPNTHSTINPHKASPPRIKPSPPKIPPKNKTKPTTHNANSHSRFFRICRRPPSLDVAIFSGARGKKRRACDWFRRKKRARYKPRKFVGRKEFLAVSELGVKGSGRGKGDETLGKGGPKKKRQVLWNNIRGFTNSMTRRLERKWGSERGTQTYAGLWLSVSAPGRWQGTGLGRMGSDLTVPTKKDSSQGEFSKHRRPPKRYPNDDGATNGDFSLTSGSPDLSVRNMEFPLREVDRGTRSDLTSGGGTKMGSFAISGFSVAREVEPEFAVGKKLKRVMTISETLAGGGRNACGSGVSMKLGLVVEGNFMPNPFAPKWKIVDERNKEAMIWGKIMTHTALAEYGKFLYNFFFQCYPPRQHLLAAYF